jgi:SAM-dependent methyltransferase
MMQKHIFLASEGDAWFARNCDRLGERDLVSGVIENAKITPKNVLEIGCANGWRLGRLREKYGCEVTGIEPSLEARTAASCDGIRTINATAAVLPLLKAAFDLVIYGFCLYLTDPEDWLQIAAEGDRVLKPGGYLIIHDFGESGKPFARRYEHCDGVLSYHVDFSKLWLGNPLYFVVTRVIAGDAMVTVLKKSRPAHAIELVP